MATYIDTTAARKTIEKNAKKIAELQSKLNNPFAVKVGAVNPATARQQIQDLQDENALLEKQIAAQHDDATGISGQNTTTANSGTGTTGSYSTVPTTSTFSTAKTPGAGDGATVYQAAAGATNWNLILGLGAAAIFVLSLGFTLTKRRKHGR